MISFQRGGASRKFAVEALNHGFLESLTRRRLSKHLDSGGSSPEPDKESRKPPNGERSIGGTFTNKKFLAPTSLRDVRSVASCLGELVPTTEVKSG